MEIFLFFTALAVRLFYLGEFRHNPYFDTLLSSTDSAQYDAGAQAFLRGDWLVHSYYNSYSPFYKYFLGALYFLFGRQFSLVYLMQFILGSASAVLIYRIGERLFQKPIALIAALLFLFYGPEIMFEGLLMRDSLVTCFGLTTFYCLLRLERAPNRKNIIVLGIASALFLQVRANTILVVLPIFAYVFFYVLKPFDHPKKIRLFLLLFGTTLLGCIPVLTACALLHHRLVFFDLNGPSIFLVGNELNYPGFGFDYYGSPAYASALAQYGETYRGMLRFIVQEMLANPVKTLFLYGRKITYFLGNFEIPENYNHYVFAKYSLLLRSPWSNFCLYSSLGLLGFILGIKKYAKLRILYWVFFGFTFGIILFFNTDRYRTPVIPYFMLFSAQALDELYRYGKSRNWAKLCAGLLFVLGLMFFLRTPQSNRDYLIRYIDYHNLAVAYENNERLRDDSLSEKYYQEAITLAKKRGVATDDLQSNLLRLYRKRAAMAWEEGKTTQALESYRSLSELDPDEFLTQFRLGVLLHQSDDQPGAIKALRNALRLKPDEPRTHLLLFYCLQNTHSSKALEHLHRALALDRVNVTNAIDAKTKAWIKKAERQAKPTGPAHEDF